MKQIRRNPGEGEAEGKGKESTLVLWKPSEERDSSRRKQPALPNATAAVVELKAGWSEFKRKLEEKNT